MWWITQVSYKLWPCCRWLHHPLTAFAKIIREHNIRGEEIDKVVVKEGGAPQMFWETESAKTGEYSMPQSLAYIAFGVEPGPEWTLRANLEEPGMVEFRKKVIWEPPMADGAIEEFLAFPKRIKPVPIPTTVEVAARGKVFRERIEYAKGDPWSPESIMTDDELQGKFRINAINIQRQSTDWKKKVDKAIELIYHLEELKDITELTNLLYP
jgi:2-methylcitrate dehydratase PrpD